MIPLPVEETQRSLFGLLSTGVIEYAEGQRRFVESFSPYARQFLERIERPPIDSLDPVAAAIAVDRRAPAKSRR